MLRQKDRSSQPAQVGMRLQTMVAWLSLAATVSAARGWAQFDSAKTTAWSGGRFHVDASGTVGRSDIVLGRANKEPKEALPLGNGSLGAAVWSEQGITAQLNRGDTLPDRLSPGQVAIPGLTALTDAADYRGRLDLYNGEFREQGAGMTATVYVQPNSDTLVIDVTGAKPGDMQSAVLKLWAPRVPRPMANGTVGILSQAWVDNKNPESSGRSFGSLSAITAEGRNVSAEVTDALTVTVSFLPFADGHFRVLAAAPHFDGSGDVSATVGPAFDRVKMETHRTWWHKFWNRAALIQVLSGDGAGEYMENLRNIYLFSAAAERGTEYPGSQAGVADMLSSARDAHRWDSSSFWHWNLRMQVAANLGAGLPELNAPYFNLYRENLSSIEDWTKRHMNGRSGGCIPETMRFNGRGIEYESSWNPISIGRDCDADFHPYYNARTLSTGAEVSLWIWRQYLETDDRAFLAENYPVMADAARFLLAYQKTGPDGLLHTSPSNAHETQWDVTDPTTDIAAAEALYPVTIEAAKLLGKDPELIRDLQTAIPKIPAFPRTQASGARTLITTETNPADEDVIAESYLPAAENHNAENIGLEPVWPYDLIGDTSQLFPLAKRTYEYRLFKGVADWSFDPIQAARLHLGSEVGSTLRTITERSQHTVNGFANWDREYGEFYIEETGIVADALQEALVQDYDGVIRIAPAIPPGWDFAGSVFVRGNTKVDVEVRGGEIVTVVIEAGTTARLRVRNPWPGQAVDVVAGSGNKPVRSSGSGQELLFDAVAGISYLLEKHSSPVTALRFAPVTGTAAPGAKKLGSVEIGIPHNSPGLTSSR
jgi:alpha-L-fucosidase 2